MQKYTLLIITLLFSFCALAADKPEAAQVYQGTLTTGVMAIGGETTGVTLKTQDGTQYELDFGKNAGLAKLADSLNGKPVIVTGVLHVRPGVETGDRHIIEVTALKGGAH
jgi:hypothetical protein